MKPALLIDLAGTLVSERPFRVAHKEWFRLFSVLLDDETISEYATKKDYFPFVHKVMQRYLGDVSQEVCTSFARNIYAMVTIAQVKEEDVQQEFLAYLRELKQKYTLVLVTTAPQTSIRPILEKIGCDALFDDCFLSPLASEPEKRSLFKAVKKKYSSIAYYIGDADEHMTLCQEINISSISVTWFEKEKVKADHTVSSVEGLKSLLS